MPKNTFETMLTNYGLGLARLADLLSSILMEFPQVKELA